MKASVRARSGAPGEENHPHGTAMKSSGDAAAFGRATKALPAGGKRAALKSLSNDKSLGSRGVGNASTSASKARAASGAKTSTAGHDSPSPLPRPPETM
jgi:hypothetical protein